MIGALRGAGCEAGGGRIVAKTDGSGAGWVVCLALPESDAVIQLERENRSVATRKNIVGDLRTW